MLLGGVLVAMTAICSAAPLAADDDNNEPDDQVAKCLAAAVLDAPPDATAQMLRSWCQQPEVSDRERNEQALRSRLAIEQSNHYNPFVLTPHYRNYILPVSYWSNPQWNDPARVDAPIDNYETKFQLSIKTPLREDFLGNGTLYGAFTSVSFWQLYNGKSSKPFRETNYQPELFVAWPTKFRLAGLDSELISVGYMHQSNGQDVPTSRSWERFFINYVFKAGSYYYSVKPWWRIPEKEKDAPGDRIGDDNPDIEHFMGHFELAVSRPFGNHVVELMLRNNLRTENRGAAMLDYSFPLSKRFKGLLQVFTGYGDSLINYNNYENRFSVGVLLTDSL